MSQIIDIDRIELIDVQKFWCLLYNMVCMMQNDRPKDSDATFIWAMFNSCVRASSMIGIVDGKMLKLILKVKRPTDADNDNNLDKYENNMIKIIESIIGIVGSPKDIEPWDGA